MQYAIVQNSVVVNVCERDGVTSWSSSLPMSHEQLVALLLQKRVLAKTDIDTTVIADVVQAHPDAVKPLSIPIALGA